MPGDNLGNYQVYVKDLSTGDIWRASSTEQGIAANGPTGGSMWTNGRYALFASRADNLVPGDTNQVLDLFRKDLVSGEIQRVSTDSNGQLANERSHSSSVSSDGRFVAFASLASNLVPGDTNSARDVFVKDLLTGEVKRVSVSATGEQGNGESGSATSTGISTNGKLVAFGTQASNLAPNDMNGGFDIVVKNVETGECIIATQTPSGLQHQPGDPAGFHFSPNGRYVGFNAYFPGLHEAPDNNGGGYIKDMKTGALRLVTVNSAGEKANRGGGLAAISDNGRFCAFNSDSTNLAEGVRAERGHAFLRNTGIGTPMVTKLAVVPGVAYIGKSVVFTAILRDRALLSPIASVPVSFRLAGAPIGGSVLTDESGKARLSYAVPESLTVGTHTLEATFSGNCFDAASTYARSLDVQRGPVQIGVPSKNATVGSSVTFHSKLMNASKTPLAGRTLNFSLDGKLLGTAVTNSMGVAARGYVVPVGTASGPHSISVKFAGDASHVAGSGTGTLTVGA